MEEFRKNLGLRIKKARIKKKITQQQLAQEACINQSTVSMLEAGKQSNLDLNDLYNISIALNMTILDLIYDYPGIASLEESMPFVGDDYNQVKNEKSRFVLRSFYPPRYYDFNVTNLLAFWVYLPLMKLSNLYEALARAEGDYTDYYKIAQQIKYLVDSIPQSEAKEYADAVCEQINQKCQAVSDKDLYSKDHLFGGDGCYWAYRELLAEKLQMVNEIEKIGNSLTELF